MKNYTHFYQILKTSLNRLSSIVLGLLFISTTAAIANNPTSLNTDLQGTIWIEEDGNYTFNGESGPSGVLVELVDSETMITLDTDISVLGEYKFSNVAAGKYFLRIPSSAFVSGASLNGAVGCPGTNDADDMIDNDDNGTDAVPNDVRTSLFTLTDDDPNNSVIVEYIDFCFEFSCTQENLLANQSCEAINSVDVLCDIAILGTFCNIMPDGISTGNQPEPLCIDGSSSAENISWFAFVAYDGLYDIVITPFACESGNLGAGGIQVGIYTDCSFTESAFCSEVCSTGPVTISSSLLSSGQTYYLFIDGCESSVCSYEVDVLGTPIFPSLDPDKVCIFDNGVLVCDTTQYCLNTDVIFQATNIDINAQFQWQVTTISGGPYTGDLAPTSTTSQLAIPFANEGLYEVCLTSVNTDCAGFSWGGSLCEFVEISSDIPVVPDEAFSDQTICLESPADFDISVLSGEDPNGDGVFGWQGPIDNFNYGLNLATIPTPGCSYDQGFILNEAIIDPPTIVEMTICASDLPIIVGGIQITDLVFAGSNNLEIDSLLLLTPNQYGCDSLINLSIEKLDIIGGQIAPPICTFNSVILDFDYIANLSTNLIYLDFDWTDPFGNSISDFDNDPTKIELDSGSSSGTYTLTISINKNGTSCLFNYLVDVDFDNFLPPAPALNGLNVVCENQGGGVIYTATGGDPSLDYIWTFPNDVANAQTSGVLENVLTIDWTGSIGGNISVQSENACGISEAASISVVVYQIETPDFNLDLAACVDNSTDIMFSGSTANISQYQWSFDGGTITNSTGAVGPGPHSILWDTPGLKTVSLVTNTNDGCISDMISKTIDIIAPIQAPNVTCAQSIDEILFLWPTVSGVEYEVNVLTGQSGIFETNNSYLVTGLMAGEEVTIELIITSTDGICTESASTQISCVTADCPQVNIVLETDDSYICVSESSESIVINAIVTSAENGTGTFVGPGIIDATGVFDPKQAELGENSIIYTFLSENSCVYFETIVIEVIEQPMANFSVSSDTICVSEVIDVSYTGTNIDMFTWDFDGGQGNNSLDTELSFDSAGVKNVSITVSNGDCTSSVDRLIVVLDQPSAAFNFSSDTICITDRVDITYTGSTNIDMFTWNFGGGQGDNNLNTQVSFTDPGVKTISIDVSNGDCVASFEKTLFVASEPTGVIISCAPGEGFVAFSWNEIEGATGYEITINGGETIFSTTPNITVDELGNNEVVEIIVVPISDNYCPHPMTNAICISQTVSTQDEDLQKLVIYPNPTQNLLFLENVKKGISYSIYNSNGQSVKSGLYSDGISTSDMVSGVYIIQVRSEEGVTGVTRFLKM